jgi:hypothetical protein
MFSYWGLLGVSTPWDNVVSFNAGWGIKSWISYLSVLISLKMTVMQKPQGQRSVLFIGVTRFQFFK